MPVLPSWIRAYIARLSVLVLAVAFGLGGSMAGCTADEPAPETTEGIQVYVGTGSDNPEAGIYRFRFAPRTGALTPVGSVTPTMNPTFLTLSAEGRHLYSVNETADSAMVSAFAVDPDTGDLTRLNQVAARGGAPCYISMDATGRWVFVANYLGGNLAVFPVQDDGSLGAATQVVSHTGSGADPERQAAPHVHYVHVDPQNRYVLAADLGIDEVRIYPFDAARGRLDTAAVRKVETPPATGPRHLAVHPNGETVYMVGELSGTVTAYDYNPEAGRMTPLQTVRTVPADFEGAARSADIHVHPSGDFVYASNRGDANGIVHYRVDDTGTLSMAGRQREQIEWPRHFAVAPGGEYLLVANRHANRITIYRIDSETGALAFTGLSATVPAPTNIMFAPTAPRPRTEP